MTILPNSFFQLILPRDLSAPLGGAVLQTLLADPPHPKQTDTPCLLKKGNSHSGLQHIVEGHGTNFTNRGISENQIPDAVITAVTKGRIVGVQGVGRTVYEVTFNSQIQYISVTVASNGYIVGANPTSDRLIRQFIRGSL